MNMDEIISDIYHIILKSNIIPQNVILKHDTQLSEYGLDSVGIVDLIILIEEKYDFEFSFSDLNLKNFETIDSISFLVQKFICHEK